MVVFLVMLVTTDTHRPLIHCGLKNDTLILITSSSYGWTISTPYPPHCPVLERLMLVLFHLFTIAWLFEFAFL